MTNALLAGSSKMFQVQYFSQSTSTCEHSGVDFCQFKSLGCVQNFKLIYRTKFAVVSGWFENEDGEQHGRGPSLQTDILHLTYSESSLAARRRKLRGQCSLKQMERRRIVSTKKLGLPTRQRKRYAGSSAGELIQEIHLPNFAEVWQLPWKTTCGLLSKRHRILVGGKTRDSGDDKIGNRNGEEPVCFHGGLIRSSTKS